MRVLSRGVGPVGRGVRWLALSVGLSLTPLAITWGFQLAGASWGTVVAHGELAVLAAAVAGATLDASLPATPRWWAWIASVASIYVLVGATIMIALAVGEARNPAPEQLVRYAAYTLGFISVVGAITVALADAPVTIILPPPPAAPAGRGDPA